MTPLPKMVSLCGVHSFVEQLDFLQACANRLNQPRLRLACSSISVCFSMQDAVEA